LFGGDSGLLRFLRFIPSWFDPTAKVEEGWWLGPEWEFAEKIMI